MGQAALKYDEFEELDQVPIPEGGIATFLTAETGSWADDDDDVPPKGITNVVKIADKLAEYGRNEDEYMVHAAEGETVIPMEVFEQNPALKEKLFAEMRIMGIEPERYVVGNELNSINPVTGQPEFFLKKLFKGLKKIVKAVLPVVATIGLTVLTGGLVSPVMASAIVSGASTAIQGGSLKDSLKAAAIGGISSFAGGQIANKAGWAADSAKRMMTQSAINTTLSGGKPVDILKIAAVAGLTTKGMDFARGKLAPAGADATATIDPAYAKELAATNPAELARLQGIEGVTVPSLTEATAPATPVTPVTPVTTVATTADATGQVAGTATQGVQGSATQGATGPATDALAGMGDLSDLGYSDTAFGQPIDPATASNMGIGQTELLRVTDPDAFARAEYTDTLRRTGQFSEEQIRAEVENTYGKPGAETSTGAGSSAGTVGVTDASGSIVPGVGESLRTVFGGKDVGLGERFSAVGDIFLPKPNVDRLMEALRLENPTDYGRDVISDANLRKIAEKQIATGAIPISPLRKYGPGAAAVLGLSALSKPEEVEGINIDDIPTGMDLIEADPAKYRIYGDDFVYRQPQFTVTRSAGNVFNVPAFTPTPLNVAEGGGIMNFPRMNGPIEGPGTETSDDIPAMLSDGEFVFTAKAVRGAGKGSREDGMDTMYRMMRQFEARA